MSEINKDALKQLIYLISCAVKDETPNKDVIDLSLLDDVFALAQKHLVAGVVAYSLEKLGIKDERFSQVLAKSIRKNMLLDADRALVCKKLEEEKIWYLPVKGIIMKDYYPKIGMRQMSDNDILFDETRRQDVRNMMEELGFKTHIYNKGIEDVYFKEPVSNFEMHVRFFDKYHGDKIYDYYLNIKDKMIKDEDNNYGYHLNKEDFYIYMIAHEYKHYHSSGTGLRSLLDTYIYINKFKDVLDWDYLNSEFKKLEIDGFEKDNRDIAFSLFNGQEISDKHIEMYERISQSGVYGTLSLRVKEGLGKKTNIFSKFLYILKRIFMPLSPKYYSVYSHDYPFLYKTKILIPLVPLVRLIKVSFKESKKIILELKALFKM